MTESIAGFHLYPDTIANPQKRRQLQELLQGAADRLHVPKPTWSESGYVAFANVTQRQVGEAFAEVDPDWTTRGVIYPL